MADDEILETIDDFQRLVNEIGDEVVNEFDGEQDGRSVRGLRCNHGEGVPFLVYAAEGNAYVTVVYQYRVLNDFTVAHLDDPEEYEKEVFIDTEERSELIEDANSDMMDLLDNIEDEVAQRFYIDILQKLKNSSVGYEVFTLDNNKVQGFEVSTHLFPLDREISPKEFYDAVQSLLSIGIPTRAYIQYSYGLRQYSGGPPIHGDVDNIVL